MGIERNNAAPVFAKVRELGATHFRPPEVMVDQWLAAGGGQRAAAGRLRQSGLKLILTVRNNGHNARGRERIPTSPPKDLKRYQEAIAEILDAYRPKVLVVENEENAPPFYYDGTRRGVWDSPEDGIDTVRAYARQLFAACEVAHERGVLCTNGGLTSGAAAALTWFYYLEQDQPKRACDFARRAFYTRQDPRAGERYCQARSAAQVPAKLRDKIVRIARPLLEVYRRAPTDLVNFHWYIHDPQALQEAVRYLRTATGKGVMTNEIGQWQWDADPAAVQPLLQALTDAQVRYAVWFSIDTGHARGLVNQDGSLRPNGEAFQNFLRKGRAR